MDKSDKIIEKGNCLGRKVVIFKPRAVIHSSISRTPTKKEEQIYNLALKKAKEKINYLSTIEKYKPIVEDWEKGIFELVPSVSISISELKHLFPHFKKRSNKDIYDIFRNMEEIKIERINILKKDNEKYINIEETSPDKVELKEEDFEYVDKVDIYRLISNVSIRFSDDTITFYLPPAIIAYLASPNMYAHINLLITNYLRSSYSIKLYEILIDVFENQKRKNTNKDYFETGKIQIDKAKHLFGISSNKYKNFFDFKKRVLQPAVNELNKSDVVPFIVEIQEIKKGRKVEWINFLIEEKPSHLINDVILTKDGPKKIAFEEKIKSGKEEYFLKKELLELKDKVKNKMPYLIFKRELMKIQNSVICNNIDGYQKHLLLKTNDIGHLELLNPKTQETIPLDNYKDLEEIRQWLYKNPDRIGDIQEIDEKEIELEDIKKRILNKYYVFKQEDLFYCLKIDSVDFKNDEVVISGEELIEGKSAKIYKKRDELEDFYSYLKDEIQQKDIEYYQEENRKVKLKKLIQAFKEKEDKNLLKEFIDYLEKASLKLSEDWIAAEKEKDEEKMDRISRQIAFQDSIIEDIALYLENEKESLNEISMREYLKYIKGVNN